MIQSNENHSTTCTQGCSPLTIAQGNCKCFNWSSNVTEPIDAVWRMEDKAVCEKNFGKCAVPCQNCLDKNGAI